MDIVVTVPDGSGWTPGLLREILRDLPAIRKNAWNTFQFSHFLKGRGYVESCEDHQSSTKRTSVKESKY